MSGTERVFPVLQKSCSVTWKGNAISVQCLGFFKVFFCLFCFVISSTRWFFSPLFPWSLEKVWNVFLLKLLHVRA